MIYTKEVNYCTECPALEDYMGVYICNLLNDRPTSNKKDFILEDCPLAKGFQDTNRVPKAMAILREAMKDKSKGELYYAWLSNIKFCVYDCIRVLEDGELEAIIKEDEGVYKLKNKVYNQIMKGCKQGAEQFLDRLLDSGE